MNETVKKDCKHEDCRYRSTFNFQPCCMYMLVTGERRGSKISECDKYRDGKIKYASLLGGFNYIDE